MNTNRFCLGKGLVPVYLLYTLCLLGVFFISYSYGALDCKKWAYGTETEIGYVVEYNNQYFRALLENNAYRDPMSFSRWWENVGANCLEPILVSSSVMSSSQAGEEGSQANSSSSASSTNTPSVNVPFTDEEGNVWNDFGSATWSWQQEFTNWERSPQSGQQCALHNSTREWPVGSGSGENLANLHSPRFPCGPNNCCT
jgi:hypothetical protein